MPDIQKKISKSREADDIDKAQRPIEQLDIVAIELRRAREDKGISHTELHRQTGISRPVLFGYEAGRTKPGAKELRLLSEALGVSPNRLLFGTDEPFKPKTGIRSLLKIRNSPELSLIMGMMLIPSAFAILDDDQIESILTVISSMVESRNKEAHRKISIIIELLNQEIGDASPQSMAAFTKKFKEPDFMSQWNKRVEELLNSK